MTTSSRGHERLPVVAFLAAQQTVESLRQSNQVIDGLNQAAGGMRSGVSRFKLVA